MKPINLRIHFVVCTILYYNTTLLFMCYTEMCMKDEENINAICKNKIHKIFASPHPPDPA